MGNALNQLIFRPHPPSYSKNNKRLHFIKTKHGSTICGFFVNNNADITVLFSHGNAEDIGDLMSSFENKIKRLGLNLFAYDYSGYGQSTGYPTETHLYNDVEAAYNYLTTNLHVPKESIVAYGRSLGSAASVHIATKRDLLGLILQAPISSIHRVKLRLKFTLPYDLFCNIDKVHLIKCPILFIHGKKDKLLTYHGTEEMIKKTKVNTYYMFIDEGGHNNLESCYGNKVNAALLTFLFVLRSNIRENVNSVYDISNMNTQKLRNMFIINNTKHMKEKVKERLGETDNVVVRKAIADDQRVDNVNKGNRVNSFASSVDRWDNTHRNVRAVKTGDSAYNSSTSVSTILGSIESVMKTIPDNTFCESESSALSVENFANYVCSNSNYDNLYARNYGVAAVSSTPGVSNGAASVVASTSGVGHGGGNSEKATHPKNSSSYVYSLKREVPVGIVPNSSSSVRGYEHLRGRNGEAVDASVHKTNIKISQTKRNSYKVDKIPKMIYEVRNVDADGKLNTMYSATVGVGKGIMGMIAIEAGVDEHFAGTSLCNKGMESSGHSRSNPSSFERSENDMLKGNRKKEDKYPEVLASTSGYIPPAQQQSTHTAIARTTIPRTAMSHESMPHAAVYHKAKPHTRMPHTTMSHEAIPHTSQGSKEACAKPYYIDRNNVRADLKNVIPGVSNGKFNSFNDFIYAEEKEELGENPVMAPLKRDVSAASSTLNNINTLFAYNSISNERLG
ncbi:alpha/beta hydrolase, putative [Plasmodium ovale]|uniref:Alpha/beta hydrolase, putative n=2 Tax=Plasmodium ovale TaxID=36330 RepID=A0A1A8X3M6_PLAOA|nr:alpha/beta hydrolase, putative [Plasmodium ovale curtisi]SBS99832.1 alpha/beta hydrolase, putative [Plasmodium ovale curtisi]SCA48333.1 alpha/beta hydrolase, putative [Plasmodium ovale]